MPKPPTPKEVRNAVRVTEAIILYLQEKPNAQWKQDGWEPVAMKDAITQVEFVRDLLSQVVAHAPSRF